MPSRSSQRRSITSCHNQLASAEDRTPATHTGNGHPRRVRLTRKRAERWQWCWWLR
ncbi:hypothetical protein BC827DRAFT_1224930 [Russula dissimulans]|nr:hypothetical protein BC827DRAFT_1224930 [Russula dissimulans]